MRFLGVDGGQTSTIAVVGDETGRVIGCGRAGPCYDHENVADAISRAGGANGFEAACLGLSGGVANREEAIRKLVPANHYRITHDAWIALAGATNAQPGVVVIAGTGSIAFGKNSDGRIARAGGWGYVLGDEGGAFDIVRQALRAALRQEEGWGAPTALGRVLLEATGAQNANDLMHRAYENEFARHRFAALAPLVDQAAAAGDGVAHAILNDAAQQLAALACSVRAQLFEPGKTVLVTYCGGVFRSVSVRERFRMLVELDDSSRVQAPRYGPAVGALLEAYALAGVKCELTCVPENL